MKVSNGSGSAWPCPKDPFARAQKIGRPVDERIRRPEDAIMLLTYLPYFTLLMGCHYATYLLTYLYFTYGIKLARANKRRRKLEAKRKLSHKTRNISLEFHGAGFCKS